MRVRISVPMEEETGRKKGILHYLFQPRDSDVERVIARHLPILARKRMQVLVRNDYGKHYKKGWEKELSYFISDVLIPEMPWWHPLRKKPPSAHALTKAAKIVERLTAEECNRLRKDGNVTSTPVEQMKPFEFENYCASRLQHAGWTARETQASGDQGVDVIAEKGGTRLVLQCKLYSKPIGNKAVQEVGTGRTHYGAHFAAVVSNHSYTVSAQQLATTNNVLLLHYTQLDDLDRILGIGERAAE